MPVPRPEGLAKVLTRHLGHHLPRQGRVVALRGRGLVFIRLLLRVARVARRGRLLALVQGRAD